MANNIQLIQDKQGNNIFPITHDRAVRDSEGVTLEARLYEINGGEININAISTTGKRVLLKNGSLVSVGTSTSVVRLFACEAGKKYKISGRVGTTTNTCLYCFYDSEDTLLEYGVLSTGTPTPYKDREIVSPASAAFIRIAGSTDDERPYAPSSIQVVDGKFDKIEKELSNIIYNRTISPALSIAAISTNTGSVTTSYYGRKFWSTVRYINVGENESISAKCSESLYMQCSWYDSNFAYLSNTVSNVSSVETTVNIPSGAKYLRVRLANGENSSEATNIRHPKLSLTGVFSDGWFVPCPRSADGYVPLTIPITLFDPNATDTETDSVQDSASRGVDYGVLALPEQYSVDGTPTRLIIYCHGAAVNYASGTTRFDSQDLDPTYWLSEGYAIMDIEGNPFDSSNEHFAMPQAYQCYKAAYEWIIENYNIRRDGVFLGGRSMGGLMVLDILTGERGIPVIAACPNVPCVVPTWYWNYMSGERRAFCATHMGFVGTAPTWSDTSPMPSSEWQYLQDNFDKMALSSPFWRMLNNLPDKNSLFNGTNISKTSTNADAEIAVYENSRIHFKAPVKIFAVKDDTTVIYQRNANILAMVAKKSGQICVERLFESGGHHYDTQNANLQTTVTNSYGVDITTSVVYVEMLAWWREWENGMW